MLKDRYILQQQKCCGSISHFSIHQMPSKDNEQQSTLSELNSKPQQYVGQFKQDSSSPLYCCSCKTIKNLQLQLYGQKLSKASTKSSCCINLCGQTLLVSTLNNILLGTIKKQCSSWCSPYYLLILNDKQEEVMKVTTKCCQAANICPRVFRCTAPLNYSILNTQDQQIATITNANTSCLTQFFTLRDRFQLIFTKVQKSKDKILILNALAFLNQLRHSLF